MSQDATRQLAAILFADVEGYTALMDKDEAAAIQLLDRFRATVLETATAHNGTVQQFYGDGCLITFSSALQAVECAQTMQGKFKNIPVRIGIHQGEIVSSGDQVYGDAINIASRIESLGTPGALLVSEPVQHMLRNQSSLQWESLGTHKLKNVPEPMQVYALVADGLTIPAKDRSESMSTRRRFPAPLLLGLLLVSAAAAYIFTSQNQPAKAQYSRIAVLPFKNLSGDRSMEYFGSGLQEEITTQLIRISGIEVAAASTLDLMNQSGLNPTDFARREGISHLLSGSVRMESGMRIIDTKLIEVADDSYLWAGSLSERDFSVASIQQAVARHVVDSLSIELAPGEQAAIEKMPTTSSEAYELYLSASQDFSWNGDTIRTKIISKLERAIALDSDFAMAHSLLGRWYFRLAEWSHEPPAPHWRMARKHIHRGYELDPNHPTILFFYADLQKSHFWDFDAALRTYERLIEMDPGRIPDFAWVLCQIGYPAKGGKIMEEYLTQFPQKRSYYNELSAYIEGQSLQLRKARELLEESSIESVLQRGRFRAFQRAETEGILGNYEVARDLLDQVYIDNKALRHGFAGYYSYRLGDLDRAERESAALYEFGETHYVTKVLYALIAMGKDNYDQVFAYLGEAYDEDDSVLLMITNFAAFKDEKFISDPRYLDLRERMGLPREVRYSEE